MNPPQESLDCRKADAVECGTAPAPTKQTNPSLAGIFKNVSLRQAKRIVVLVLGVSVMLLGICLLVLPGPGLVLMAGALAILGTEFAIARRWLQKLRRFSAESIEKLRPRNNDWHG